MNLIFNNFFTILFILSTIQTHYKVLCDQIKNINYNKNQDSDLKNDTIPLGHCLNIFPRFGYLSITFRVVSREDDYRICLEPTASIFEETSYKKVYNSNSNNSKPRGKLTSISMTFCDDVQDLLRNYFLKFKIDGLEGNSWSLFSGGWREYSISKYLGIQTNYTSFDYKYIFARADIVKQTGELKFVKNNQPTVKENYKKIMNEMLKDEDLNYVSAFYDKLGTHFIKYFEIGNSLFQVFVYEPSKFREIKENFISCKNDHSTKECILKILTKLTSNSKIIGELMVLSSSREDPEMETRIINELVMGNDPNIFKLLKISKGERSYIESQLLTNADAILRMDFLSNEIMLNKEHKKKYNETLKNNIHLWECNMN